MKLRRIESNAPERSTESTRNRAKRADMKVLVTGGAGYIGSHTCVELMQAGHEVIIFDNLCNSHRAVIGRIARIAGRTPQVAPADVREPGALRDAFSRPRFDALIHFPRLKAVGETGGKPIQDYDNHV